MSVRRMLQNNKAHCFEGAMLAAAVLWYHGEKPLLLDLKCDGYDTDHVVALFKKNNHWGAISKTNHSVLRYREPIYKTIRELSMSYFHEYFTEKGKKTLRSYSKPFNLTKFKKDWIISERDLWDISEALDNSKHFPFMTKIMRKSLRKADKVEILAGNITEYKKN